MYTGLMEKKEHAIKDDIDVCAALVQDYLPIVTGYAYEEAINNSVTAQDLYEISEITGLLQSSWRGMLREVANIRYLA